MPSASRDPRGDNRSKAAKGVSRYGGASAARSVGDNLLLDIDGSRDAVACINAVLQAGDAIMFSRTTNGSVICLTLYSGDTKEKLYAKDADALQDLLAEVENQAREAHDGTTP